MKKILVISAFLFLLPFFYAPPAAAQEQELAQLVLDLEKLNQLRQILQKMYDGYKILTQGYEKVKEITSGNYKLHEIFLDGLMLVSPTVKKYGRIAEIIEYEIKIVSESKSALNRLKGSGALNPESLDYVIGVYDKVLGSSLQGLDELTIVITSGNLRMSDDERLRAIDRLYADMKGRLVFVRAFTRDNAVNAAQRIKEKTEIGTIDNLYNK